MPADFGQQVKGLHLAGDSVSADDQHIGIFAKSSGGTYEFLAVDANGQLELAHDINTNALFSTITDGTDDLAIYNAGDIADTGIGMMGKDPSGNMQYLKVGNDGELVINIGSADSTYTYGSSNLVKDTATTVVTESPVSTTNYRGVIVSGFGKAEWEVKFGVTLSEATIIRVTTTPSNTTQYIQFPAPLSVDSGETILVSATNRENSASPTSDFSGSATLIKEA